jgi:hypothetical protein
MKHLLIPKNFRSSISLMVCILILISCQKEIKTPNKETPAGLTANVSNSCKPVGLALYRTPENFWMNMMLRWYDAAGRISHLKAVVMEVENISQPLYSLDYGEVTYVNDMVYLRDVYTNKIVLSVKLDNMGHPQTSWFDGSFHASSPMADVSNFYYSASGTFDSVIISYRIGNPSEPFTTIVYRAEYDANGNTTHLTGPPNRINFYYDYSKPNPGLVPHYVVSTPIKLLEYLDLFHLPHKNLLTEVTAGQYPSSYPYPDNTFPVYGWAFASPVTNSTGQIYYYEQNAGRSKYYAAWECNNTPMIQSKNPTQEEFMRMIH